MVLRIAAAFSSGDAGILPLPSELSSIGCAALSVTRAPNPCISAYARISAVHLVRSSVGASPVKPGIFHVITSPTIERVIFFFADTAAGTTGIPAPSVTIATVGDTADFSTDETAERELRADWAITPPSRRVGNGGQSPAIPPNNNHNDILHGCNARARFTQNKIGMSQWCNIELRLTNRHSPAPPSGSNTWSPAAWPQLEARRLGRTLRKS